MTMFKRSTAIFKMLAISKRIRFLISSLILSVGFIGIQAIDDSYKFIAIAILVLMAGIFSVWSFFEGLGKDMTILSLVLPMLFTLGVGIFWFLLPSNIYTKIPIVIFFTLGIYILFSTMNIYTVSSSRTIALLRAARGVGFVITLVTAFLLFDAILSLRQNVFVSSPFIFLTSLLLFLQGFWSIELDKKMDSGLLNLSLISSLVITEFSIIISFWPVTLVVGSLFLTSGVYMLLGLGQTKLEDRLFPNAIREYLTVGAIVLVGMFFATHWK